MSIFHYYRGCDAGILGQESLCMSWKARNHKISLAINISVSGFDSSAVSFIQVPESLYVPHDLQTAVE